MEYPLIILIFQRIWSWECYGFDKYRIVEGYFVLFKLNLHKYFLFFVFLTFSRQIYNSISPHFIDFLKNMVMRVLWFWQKQVIS